MRRGLAVAHHFPYLFMSCRKEKVQDLVISAPGIDS